MIKHICGDCGAAFHLSESWETHQCDVPCTGDCDHERCVKCTSGNGRLMCQHCVASTQAGVNAQLANLNDILQVLGELRAKGGQR